MKQQGLKPLIDGESKILILGTLPGEKSLEKKEYYSNPRSLFWNAVFARLRGVNLRSLSYKDKKVLLKKLHIAIWDVYKEVDRKKGSSGDKDIKMDSGSFNDVPKLLKRYPSVKKIAFCGVSRNTKRHYDAFLKKFQNAIGGVNIKMVFLPNPSGSNRTCSRKSIIEEWQKQLR